MKERTTEFILRAFLVAGVVVLVLLLWQIVTILLLIFGAVLTAIVLRMLSQPLGQRLGVSDHTALACTVVGLLLMVGLTGWLMGSIVNEQLGQLKQEIPASWENAKNSLEQFYLGNMLVEELEQGGFKDGVLSKLPVAAFSVVESIANFLIVIVCGVFIAARPALYRQGLLKLFPETMRVHLSDAFMLSDQALRMWFKGKIISMLCLAVMITLALWIIGVPSALAIGVIAGMAEFIPYIGAFLSAVPAVLLGLLDGPSTALWVVVAFFVTQQIQGNLIMPLIQQHMVQLPPALTIFALLIMGYLFGLLGLLLAEPLTVFLFVMVKKLYVRDVLHLRTKIPGVTSKGK
jgi:predicted PurR-regulated permease PerM